MVAISGREVGDGHPVFITLEAGPTHNGLASAKRLVDLSREAGADAIKFQILDADRLVRDPGMTVKYGYLEDRETGRVAEKEEPLRDVLRRRGMARDEWLELKAYADTQGIAFFATVSFQEEIDLVVEMNCPSIKVASLDVNHAPLLRQVARHDLCIQLDTGSATLGEVEAAVDLLLEEGNENFIIHQCPSGYPARLESINLRIIQTLKRMFGCPVAFSDHTPGWDMDIAAVALGANLIEKTITEDRTQHSPEHVMSLEAAEAKAFVQAIRDVEVAMGSARRIMTRDERERRALRRRSAFARKAYPAGTPLAELEIDFARPGNGLAPDDVERLTGARLAQGIAADELLTIKHLSFQD